MNILNSVYDVNWKPRVVIEASAGTGKTYTIVGLYVRLLIEKNLDVDQILVMTFTTKATSELRGRILERLRECLSRLDSGKATDDPFLEEFAENVGKRDVSEIVQQLKNAIRNFDDSRIFTIHGFCQKVLTEEPLLAGVPLDMDVTAGDDLLLQAAGDFWRSWMKQWDDSEAGPVMIQSLLDIAPNPAELVGSDGLGELFRSRGAQPEGEGVENPESLICDSIGLKKELNRMWQNERANIERIFEECDVKAYASRNNRARIREMDEFMAGGNDRLIPPDKFKYFTAEKILDENNLKNNGSPTEFHPFFDLCSQFASRAESLEKIRNEVILQAFDEIAKRRDELSRQSRTMTYDDLLVRVQQALQDEERGSLLAEKLRRQYPFALVDEFQDTDAVQYSIFDAVYPPAESDSGLLMIGDPKQAIYAFRGADIYTYFKARKAYDPEICRLQKNFRSSPRLIGAINRLFDAPDSNRFLEDRIRFFPSDAGNQKIGREYLKNGEPPVPLQIRMDTNFYSGKRELKSIVEKEVLRQLSELLASSSYTIRDDVSKQMRPLRAGDIAILVNSHSDALNLKNRLKEAGVDAITYSQQSVFSTFEARRLLLLMKAVLEPLNRSVLHSALLSGLFGIDLGELYHLKEDEQSRHQLTAELQELNRAWHLRGFMAMFRRLLRRPGRMDELARLRNAERILTNLQQLAEIASSEETNQQFDPHALCTWFGKQMVDPGNSDEQTLLLESDRNLVKISTIHSSKGLEFPVVICPTLWEGRKANHKNLFSYHRKSDEQLMINIDQTGAEETIEAMEESIMEALAESVRKAYVALTRAKYDCRVIWGTHSESHLSGLGAALTGRENLMETVRSSLKDGEENANPFFSNVFQELAGEFPDEIFCDEIPEPEVDAEPFRFIPDHEPMAEPLPYNGRMTLPVQKQMASFSSLAHHNSDPREPDHDEVSLRFSRQFENSPSESGKKTIFTFPKGATAGSAIHKLFEDERVDFTTLGMDDLAPVIDEVLEEYAIGKEWSPVMESMMHDVVHANYRDFSLANVPRGDRLVEMEFHFPIASSDVGELMDVIDDGAQPAGTPESLRHYLTGFIDLVVRQNGKYYILDYKSNYLGDHPEDYSTARLGKAIQESAYHLQYHLYTVALVKMLENHIPGFDYDTHFGGVAYLFVRGMKAGSDHGIWFDKPSRSTIENLQTLLNR
jgi:exodeoxyribonuclease V beta subunit